LTDETAPAELPTEGFDRAAIGVRLDEERRRASLLGDVREAIFGAQDVLVSTLAVVSAVAVRAFAGVVGYFFGSILPALLGAPPVGG
jgi:hypothetical protein